MRNAFGNFRDVLREITFNPLMGRYLTNTGSSSFDYNGRFPNENFAREIMQLFSATGLLLCFASFSGSQKKDSFLTRRLNAVLDPMFVACRPERFQAWADG